MVKLLYVHLLCFILVWQAAVTALADPTTPTWVCAVVDGEPITYEDLRVQLALKGKKLPLERVRNRLPISGIEHLILRDAIGTLIEEAIALHRAKMERISLDAKDEEQIKKWIEEETKARGGTAQYEAALQQAGLSIEILKNKSRALLIIRKLGEKKVSADLFISPRELRQYSHKMAESVGGQKEVTYKEIVLALENWKRRARESRELAKGIRERLAKGEDFAALQREFSEGYEEGKDNLCGPVPLESLKKPIRDSIAQVSEGAIIEPIEVGGWIYIIKLLSCEETRPKPLRELCSQIEKELRKLKMDKLYSAYLDEIFKRASVRLQVAGLTLADVSPAAARSADEERQSDQELPPP